LRAGCMAALEAEPPVLETAEAPTGLDAEFAAL
jgi:hypothetical protein